MHPVLFEAFGFKVYSFGLMVALAFLVGFAVMLHRARQAGENVEDYMESTIWLIIAGIGGARLFYFLFFPQVFLADPVGSLFSQGGLVWYGGMIGVTLTVLLFTRIKRICISRYGDILAPGAAVGLAIGRIGCLLAGCCYGGPCKLPWAIHYPHDHVTAGMAVHPSPLYETFLLLGVFGLLLWIDRRKPFEGLTTWSFFVLYGIVRFILEYYRGDRLVWIDALNLSASQVISLASIAAGLIMLWLLNRRRPAAVASQTTASAPASDPA